VVESTPRWQDAGPTGKVYGLDMTDEMLELARANQAKTGVTPLSFKGDIEHIPLPDNSIDLIISNCVINLSPDTDRVLAEAFRVLEAGWAVCGIGHRDPRRHAEGNSAEHRIMGWVHSGSIGRNRIQEETQSGRVRAGVNRRHARLYGPRCSRPIQWDGS
jgi:SAM-dependent methyltransferase